MNGWERLRPDQAAAARRAVAEESARREHVVIYLSGAHAYGFPSPDSDLDLKCVHLAPTAEFLGLGRPPVAVDRAEVLDGIELDYTSHELGQVLHGILKGNGNYLERVLGDCVLEESPLLAALRPLAQRALSTRVWRHYAGFASQQLAEATKAPSVKHVLYVLRTALTGTHGLRTGRIEADLTRLLPEYGFHDASELVAAKQAGERCPLPEEDWRRWQPRLLRALAHLDEARAQSPLPAEPPNAGELDDWLRSVRRAHR
jgi:predicted nucleotidyltransferase